MADNQPSLDEMIAQYQSGQNKMTESTPVQQVSAKSSGPSLDEMINQYQSQKGGQQSLPSFTEYAKKTISDITPTATQAQQFFGISGTKDLGKDINEDIRNTASKGTALGTGAVQGLANTAYGVYATPQAAYNAYEWLTQNPDRMHYADNGPPQVPMTQYQKSAMLEHPYYGTAGNVLGSTVGMSPAMLGVDAATGAANLIGRGAAAGFVGTPSGNVGEKIAGGALGAAGTAAPMLAGKGMQGLMQRYTGKEIDQEAKDAFDRLGIQDKVPHVFNTTDADAQKQLVNDIAPAFGNAKVRESLHDLGSTMDQKTNALTNDFDLRDKNGNSLIGENGEMPPMGDVTKNIQDKINAKYSEVVNNHKKGYEDLNNKARELGVTSTAPNYREALENIAEWRPSEHDIVGGPSKEVQANAKEMLNNLKSIGKPLSFEGITRSVPKLNDLIRDNADNPAQKAFYKTLRDAAEKDIDEAVNGSGHPELRNQLQENKKYFKENVVPFFDRQNPSKLAKYVGEGAKPHEGILNDLVAQGKNGNATALKNTLRLVPDIKEDLGYLQLNSGGAQLGKEVRPDIRNALQGVASMHPDTAEALFNPDKLQYIRDLRTATNKLDPLLNYGKNPATGQRVQQSKARKIFDLAKASPAQLVALSGNLAGGLGTYAAQQIGKIGVNKMIGTLMLNPKAFETANAKSLLSPAAKKAYSSLMLGSSNQALQKLDNNQER